MRRNSGILFSLVIFGFGCEYCFAREGRLVNAKISDLTYFPCMVQIVNSINQHICGGCVLDEENVLTSARCLYQFLRRDPRTGLHLKVRGGDVVITKKNLPSYQERKVRRFIVHPDYNEASLENDLALLKIADPFMPSVNLHPIQAGMTSPKGRCFLPGWTSESLNRSVLHYATVYITSDDKCSQVVKNTICAESKTNEGACDTDYGGPLVCGRKVFGVFIGPRDACQCKPALFTNLSPFEDWMDLNIHESEIELPSGRKLKHSSGSTIFASFKLIKVLFHIIYAIVMMLKI